MNSEKINEKNIHVEYSDNKLLESEYIKKISGSEINELFKIIPNFQEKFNNVYKKVVNKKIDNFKVIYIKKYSPSSLRKRYERAVKNISNTSTLQSKNIKSKSKNNIKLYFRLLYRILLHKKIVMFYKNYLNDSDKFIDKSSEFNNKSNDLDNEDDEFDDNSNNKKNELDNEKDKDDDKNNLSWENSEDDKSDNGNVKNNDDSKSDYTEESIEGDSGGSDPQPKTEKIFDELGCEICKKLCENPITTSCCFKNFCKKCFLDEKQNCGWCPGCSAESYNYPMSNDIIKKKIIKYKKLLRSDD